jgi:hypothetical protein
MTSLTFEERLKTTDNELAARGCPLRLRPLETFKILHGPVMDRETRLKLFEPISRWFVAAYGERAAWDGIIARIPVIIRGAVYLLRLPFQEKTNAVNLLDQVEDLPDEIAKNLSPGEFRDIGDRSVAGWLSFGSLYNLRIDDHILSQQDRELFWRATEDLDVAAYSLKHGESTQIPIFHSHEAAEKMLKIAFRRVDPSIDVTTYKHHARTLFRDLLKIAPECAWLSDSVDHLDIQVPNMHIRYKDLRKTLEVALVSFNAASNIAGSLACMWLFDDKRKGRPARFYAGTFYKDCQDQVWYCKGIFASGLKVSLTQLGETPDGRLLMFDRISPISIAPLFLEITDQSEIQRLRNLRQFYRRVCNRRLQPEDFRVRIHSGVEGSFVTGEVRTKLTKEGWEDLQPARFKRNNSAEPNS